MVRMDALGELSLLALWSGWMLLANSPSWPYGLDGCSWRTLRSVKRLSPQPHRPFEGYLATSSTRPHNPPWTVRSNATRHTIGRRMPTRSATTVSCNDSQLQRQSAATTISCNDDQRDVLFSLYQSSSCPVIAEHRGCPRSASCCSLF